MNDKIIEPNFTVGRFLIYVWFNNNNREFQVPLCTYAKMSLKYFENYQVFIKC